jgi:hypothetical protein
VTKELKEHSISIENGEQCEPLLCRVTTFFGGNSCQWPSHRSLIETRTARTNKIRFTEGTPGSNRREPFFDMLVFLKCLPPFLIQYVRTLVASQKAQVT